MRNIDWVKEIDDSFVGSRIGPNNGKKYHVASIPDRFWSKVDIRGMDECWNWLRSSRHNGDGYEYGAFRVRDGLVEDAHRMSFILSYDVSIPSGYQVCHACDNARCCNPNHLFLGSPKDNAQDMVSKDRQCNRRGERNTVAKISDNEARKIYDLYQTKKYLQKDLANMFNVSRSCVGRIVLKKGWTHIHES